MSSATSTAAPLTLLQCKNETPSNIDGSTVFDSQVWVDLCFQTEASAQRSEDYLLRLKNLGVRPHVVEYRSFNDERYSAIQRAARYITDGLASNVHITARYPLDPESTVKVANRPSSGAEGYPGFEAISTTAQVQASGEASPLSGGRKGRIVLSLLPDRDYERAKEREARSGLTSGAWKSPSANTIKIGRNTFTHRGAGNVYNHTGTGSVNMSFGNGPVFTGNHSNATLDFKAGAGSANDAPDEKTTAVETATERARRAIAYAALCASGHILVLHGAKEAEDQIGFTDSEEDRTALVDATKTQSSEIRKGLSTAAGAEVQEHGKGGQPEAPPLDVDVVVLVLGVELEDALKSSVSGADVPEQASLRAESPDSDGWEKV